ncbi:type IV pilin-like G/H family protein [Microcoleus sp. bin38.metabat.b11b12b14.051]|uniref:type IV pilin-like G/H family protein n=1 Tax=Microcoleus sp. bin38.metabat.b11b12b14.051 TaxID=2742709 RepID=UPI0025F271B3|nr:type IV pilin-like G/H family protein [Microcoleus sp. bin38.metabat.b11b12b14.051]
MQKTYLNISRLLIGGCCLLSVSKFAISAIAQPIAPPAPILAQTTTPTAKTVAEKLVGQWQLQYLLSVPVTVIFTQEGKLFILTWSFPFAPPTEPLTAYEFKYRINSTTQPMAIDVIANAIETLQTIFEFTPNGQIRVEFIGLKSREARPTTFTTGALFLQKLSTTTALPRNTIIKTFNQFVGETSRQAYESVQYIRSMLNAQQAFYAENTKFATTFEEMGIGMKFEEENYRYQILSQSNFTEDVIMTVQAKKPQLRSYTGAVFLVQVKDDKENVRTSVAFSCVTNWPSTSPPPRPIVPKNNDPENFRCPVGSSLITR